MVALARVVLKVGELARRVLPQRPHLRDERDEEDGRDEGLRAWMSANTCERGQVVELPKRGTVKRREEKERTRNFLPGPS